MRVEVDKAGNEGRIQAFSRKHQTGLVTLVFTDLVATNRELELAGNAKYKNRRGPSQKQLTRREWEAIERPLCFLVPEKAADRSGPVCTLHPDHVVGGSSGPQTLCSLHSLNPGATNHIALVAASGDSSDSDEDEDY